MLQTYRPNAFASITILFRPDFIWNYQLGADWSFGDRQALAHDNRLQSSIEQQQIGSEIASLSTLVCQDNSSFEMQM
jgi:hypothetical protein